MSWVAVGAAIVTAVAGYENNKQVAHRQDSELASQLRQQGSLQQQENAQANQLIQKTAASSPDAAKSSLLGQFQQQLMQSQGNATRPLAQVGNVSGAYTKAANDAALGVSDYGNKNAGLLAAIDAPGIQRQGEAANLSRFGTQLNEVKRQSAADQFLSQIRLQGIRPNPWLTAVADGAKAYSAASAGGGGSGGGADAWSQGNTAAAGGGFTYNMPNY